MVELIRPFTPFFLTAMAYVPLGELMSQEVKKIIRHEFHKCNSIEELCSRFAALIAQYDALAATHIAWFTHKNPYGCWICDLFSDIRTFGNYLDAFLRNDVSESYDGGSPNIG